MSIDFAPLYAAPWYIQIHAISAMAAFVLGGIQFAAPKGTLPHKTLGIIWVGLMSAVTISSAFILGPPVEGGTFFDRLSFIHIFTLITAYGIYGGLRFLIAGSPALKNHWKPFLGIYIGGLVVAGAFAFTPGRIMHQIVFGN
ncbi:MAG: hypothetical protein AAFR65_15940 [Pseudomonadota bacterium]